MTKTLPDRRTAAEMVITVNEAAFAAGVPVKSVNQAIDREHVRTRVLRRAGDRGRRGISASDAVYLSVRGVLAPELRLRFYPLFRGKRFSELPRHLEIGNVVVDVGRAIDAVESRLNLLSRIDERVEIDPEVRAGDPVFQGTRTPVHAIARKIELGSSLDELREDYPHLHPDDFELATLYAHLYPRRGRPRTDGARGLKRDPSDGPAA